MKSDVMLRHVSFWEDYSLYAQLLVVRISEQGATRSGDEGTSGGTQVNRTIQQLAQKYCGDCKNSFDDLSKVIQVRSFPV